MAALDGEAGPDAVDLPPDWRTHVASCASCREWVRDLESMGARLRRVEYPDPPRDLWGPVAGRLRQPDSQSTVPYRLLTVGALVLCWRALQLLIDLPLPALHPLVPLACVSAALWQIASDSLAIATCAPELGKEGI
jgi:hypothetical protein